MIYECSNHHRFEVSDEPARCSELGCESRVLRVVGEAQAAAALATEMSDDRVGKAFRILSAITVALSCIGAAVFAQLAEDDFPTGDPSPAAIGAVLLFGIAMCTGLAATACFLNGIHRSWKLAQLAQGRHRDLEHPPTPGKAVGLMFVPLVNLVWQFKAYAALPNALAAVAEVKHLDGSKMSPELALVMCWVNVVATLVPAVAGGADAEIAAVVSWLLTGVAGVLWFVFGNEMFKVSWELQGKLAT